MLELSRQKRVIDMMITSHSILRDRYTTLSSIFENTLLIASVILNALVFVDAKLITDTIHITENTQKLTIGVVSIIVFAVSVVLLQVRWKEKAEKHLKASEDLVILKQKLRDISDVVDTNVQKQSFEKFKQQYIKVTNSIVKIPDSQFNSLKLKHYRKIELSKLIDQYPGSRLWVLITRLFFSSFTKKV